VLTKPDPENIISTKFYQEAYGMAEDEHYSAYEKQKNSKPDVKEIISITCDGETKQMALEFADYLYELKMKPTWASTSSYAFNYKGKRGGYFKVGRGGNFEKNNVDILIYPVEMKHYENYLLTKSEEEKAIFKNTFFSLYLKHCSCCGKCAPGICASIFKQDFENICRWIAPGITNPNKGQIKFIKELIDLCRNYIEG